MHVAIRELKSSLSRILVLAQGGEVIEVTSHNKLIARIVGIPALDNEGLRQLMAKGALAWNGSKPSFAPALELMPGGKSMAQMVLEDRG